MKFKTNDERYLSSRKNLQTVSGLEFWEIVDQWPLYVGIGNLSRCIAISDLVRQTLNVPGHIAEFGSFKGANLLFMAKIMKIFDPYSYKQVFCFESFEGLQKFLPQDGYSKAFQGKYRGGYPQLAEMIELYEMQNDIVMHIGDIMNTLPKALQNDALSFSLVYCDTDLYEPTSLILNSLHKRLSVGGLFILDEWCYDRWPGETVAVREFMEQYGDFYQMENVRNARQPSLVLRKVKPK